MDHMEDLNIWTFIKQGLIEREFLFLQQAISQGVLLINPKLHNEVFMRKACKADPPRGTWTFIGEDRGTIPTDTHPRHFSFQPVATRQPH